MAKASAVQNLRKFLAPEIIFGTGARSLAGQYAANFNVSKVLLVTDPGVMAAGWVDDVKMSLTGAGVDFVLYSDVSPNPRAAEVMAGTKLYVDEQCDGIVAVGGGSPMDCAKGIGIVALNGQHILDFEGVNQIKNPLPPMVFIPTTAGTSADVSQFCIITDREELRKIAIVSKIVIPDVALIDSETTTSMDPYLTACTGMDAMVHAIEAFVSTASSDITDIHALKAIELLSNYLPRVTNEANDMKVRENIMLASMQAGLAFSNAVLGAVHAMAHSMGGLLDLPHGECNSLLLEHVVNFNFHAAPDRFEQIALAMGLNIKGLDSKQLNLAIFNYINGLRNSLGITKRLGLVGVKTSDINQLSKNAMADACMLTNPRKPTKRDIEVIYEEAH